MHITGTYVTFTDLEFPCRLWRVDRCVTEHYKCAISSCTTTTAKWPDIISHIRCHLGIAMSAQSQVAQLGPTWISPLPPEPTRYTSDEGLSGHADNDEDRVATDDDWDLAYEPEI